MQLRRFFNSTPLLLMGICALAFGLRIMGLNWDDHSHLHPDERFMTSIAASIGQPDLVLEGEAATCSEAEKRAYFNTRCSSLNPNNIAPGSYVYGTLPLFIVRGVAVWMGEQGEIPWSNYDHIHFVGRGVNAIFDTFSVLLVFILGWRLLGKRAGLVAAAFYAGAVLPIQLSHFWTVDIIAHFFFLLGLVAAVEIAKTGRARAFVLYGLAFGAALASRINLFPMAILLPLAALIYLENLRGHYPLEAIPHFKLGQTALPAQTLHRGWVLAAGQTVLLGFLALGIAFAAFRVFQPYAFVGPAWSDWGDLNDKWVRDTIEVSRLSQDYSEGWPPSNQWYGRAAYLYPWFNLSMWGLGLALGLSATLALLRFVYQFIGRVWEQVAAWIGGGSSLDRGPWPLMSLFIVWILAFFGYQGGIHQMTMRYYLPLYAILCLMAVWGLFQLPLRARKAGVLLVLVSTLFWAGAFTSIYRQPLTRLEASEWIVDHLPSTFTLEDEGGRALPGELGMERGHFPLITVANREGYLSEPFEINQQMQTIPAIHFEFTQAGAAEIRLQLLTQEDILASQPLYSFEFAADEAGRAILELSPEDFPLPSPNLYRWQVQITWQGGGPLRYVLAYGVWLDRDGQAQQKSLFFSNPYSSIQYAMIADPTYLEIQSKIPIEVRTFSIPNAINPQNELRAWVNDQETTARLIESSPPDGALGQAVRYELAQPLRVEPYAALRLNAPAPMFITGTVIASEGAWDDPLPWSICQTDPPPRPWYRPVRLINECNQMSPYSMGYYAEAPLHMAEPDLLDKQLRMMDVLNKADYLVISSNRFYDALPRNPERFPFSTHFYELLFEGETFNYELWRVFQSPPRLGPITLPDQALPHQNWPAWLNELEAEEAFTVYDHPTVYIFRNAGFQAQNFPKTPPPTLNNRITLSDYQATFIPAESTPSPAQTTQQAALWLAGFMALGWLSYPLLWWCLPGAPLRGFGFGRGAAWLSLSLAAWWLTAATPLPLWTRGGVWAVMLAWLGLNAWVLARYRAEILAYIRQHGRTFLVYEAVFLLLLGIGLGLRAVNPDLWHPDRGGEKPMDFAYFNAVLRTDDFPPPAPWRSGFSINYYYFGFVLAAFPTKLGAFAPEVAANVALVSLYAVVGSHIFSLLMAWLGAARPRWRFAGAMLGLAFVMLLGNLGAFYLWLNPEPNMHPNRWYWFPTRILAESDNGAGGAITEVPFFSFLYGDLHAHLMSLLPATLFILALWQLLKSRTLAWGAPLGMLASVLYMTNTWDVLLYIPVAALLMIVAAETWPRFLRLSGVVFVSAVLTLAPYYLRFNLGGNSGIQAWEGPRSLFPEFLLTWGLPVGVVGVWIIYRLKALLTPQADSPIELGLLLLGLGPLWWAYQTDSTLASAVLCGMLALLSLILALWDQKSLRPLHGGVALIFGLLLFTEYFVVRGDVGRQNTVFKIAFQLWLWLGLLIPLLLYQLWQVQRAYVGVGAALALLSLGLMYPIQAWPARHVDNQTGRWGLNGYQFMEGMELYYGPIPIETRQDGALTRWMRANLRDFPVILEWYQSEYQWNGRVSVQTGFPAVMGWANHMRQQFSSPAQHQDLDRRLGEVLLFYSTQELEDMRRILAEYGVQYVVYGQLERAFGGVNTAALLQTLVESGELSLVYEQDQTRLYQVELWQAGG
jgi:YYY domain-containing protein